MTTPGQGVEKRRSTEHARNTVARPPCRIRGHDRHPGRGLRQCGDTHPAPSATAAPTPAPTQAATAAPYAALTYPSAGGEVDCAGQTFNGQAYVGELKQIKALDAKTVEFTLCTPDVAFVSKVAFASVPVFDADWLAKAVADGSFLDKPNGTGPYRLKEWTKGERMVLEANPDYWGDKPQVPNLVFGGAPRRPSGWSSWVARRRRDRQPRHRRHRHDPGGFRASGSNRGRR
jgi:hypothetical protein